MKKMVSFLLVAALAVTLSACAAPKAGTAKVKCPACGYEFDAPVE